MKTILLPEKSSWPDLCNRPGIEKKQLEATIRGILDNVRYNTDFAVLAYSEEFDGIRPVNLKVTTSEISESEKSIPADLKKALRVAQKNITKFHSAQIVREPVIETIKGVRCWRKSLPIEKVGLYIPGGSAPLFSTLLMLGIPAKLAGCREIVVCTPPGKDGKINPIILYTASLLGISNIFKVGGAQAIAAMAYGTETIPAVYKIFGPGNQFVTKAKEFVMQDGIAIDMPAGPSEVLVIADNSADPGFVAADLLSQAEHGPDSQVIMLTDSPDIIEAVKSEISWQIENLPRKEIALKAIDHSRLILLPSVGSCIEFSNLYAPEHLIINAKNAGKVAEKVTNAGSVFIGNYTCESAGDYASGTNHTLPTNGFARNYSGVSVESFMKKISFQEINSEGLKKLGPSIELLAEAESLSGHRNAVSIRLKSLEND
jgi:histidinol dehydrogenase